MQTGIINKPEKFNSYFVVPREVFRDNSLSTGAVGLFCFLLSHSSDFKITVEYCINAFKDGKDAIRNRFKELIDAGYLDKVQVRDSKTKKFLGYNFTIKLPQSGKAGDGKAGGGKPAIKNNNIIHNIKTYKEIVVECYKNIVLLFDEEYRPKTETQKNKWLDVIDELDRLDGVNPRQVFYITKRTLEDEFWSENFRSPLKLRRKNKDGIKWIVVFKNKYAKDMKV
jgi:hypothetical protein